MTFEFHVAQLLAEPVGSTREDVLGPAGLAEGTVRLTRIGGGILVSVDAEVPGQFECSRCLALFSAGTRVRFDEVYYQRFDPDTGRAFEAPEDEPDPFYISTNHVIDLKEALRQYTELSAAIKPLCRPDCPGLCAQCGADLATSTCGCAPEPPDPRLAVLAAFAVREEPHK